MQCISELCDHMQGAYATYLCAVSLDASEGQTLRCSCSHNCAGFVCLKLQCVEDAVCSHRTHPDLYPKTCFILPVVMDDETSKPG